MSVAGRNTTWDASPRIVHLHFRNAYLREYVNLPPRAARHTNASRNCTTIVVNYDTPHCIVRRAYYPSSASNLDASSAVTGTGASPSRLLATLSSCVFLPVDFSDARRSLNGHSTRGNTTAEPSQRCLRMKDDAARESHGNCVISQLRILSFPDTFYASFQPELCAASHD